MTLMQELKAASKPMQRCKFGRWFDSLDLKYQKEVQEVLESDFSTYTISRVLVKKHPQAFSVDVFIRHREKRCCCVSQ